MDGMLYRPEGDDKIDCATPAPGVAKLLLITIVAAVAIVGAMLLLDRAGVNLRMPDEFPSIAASD